MNGLVLLLRSHLSFQDCVRMAVSHAHCILLRDKIQIVHVDLLLALNVTNIRWKKFSDFHQLTERRTRVPTEECMHQERHGTRLHAKSRSQMIRGSIYIHWRMSSVYQSSDRLHKLACI